MNARYKNLNLQMFTIGNYHVTERKTPEIIVVIELRLSRRSEFAAKDPELPAALRYGYRLMRASRRRRIGSLDQ